MTTITNKDGRVITRNEFITEWQADLRSGEYQQGKDELCGDNRYCCLGVACLTGQRLGITEAEWGNEQSQESSLPGLWFAELTGSVNPTACVEGLKHHLSVWNDLYGMSFSQIADMLDQLREPEGGAA